MWAPFIGECCTLAVLMTGVFVMLRGVEHEKRNRGLWRAFAWFVVGIVTLGSITLFLPLMGQMLEALRKTALRDLLIATVALTVVILLLVLILKNAMRKGSGTDQGDES